MALQVTPTLILHKQHPYQTQQLFLVVVVVLNIKVLHQVKVLLVQVHSLTLILVEGVMDLRLVVVEALVAVDLLKALVALVVKDHNYLGLYQHGDGDKVILRVNQQTHQLQMVVLVLDHKVQQENLLGDMDGLQEVVEEEIIVGQVVVLPMRVEDWEQVQQCRPMMDLLLADLMVLLVGVLLILVVVEAVLVIINSQDKGLVVL